MNTCRQVIQTFCSWRLCSSQLQSSGTQNYIPLATNAVRQGLLVGNNLTDHKMAYRGTQGTSGLYLFGWTIGSTGVTKESATLNDLEVQATVFEDNYRPEFMPTTEKK